MRGGAYFEVDVRARQVKLFEKDVGDTVVIVLTGMYEYLREILRHRRHLPDERRYLHEVRARSHHMHYPHSPEHNKQARARFSGWLWFYGCITVAGTGC